MDDIKSYTFPINSPPYISLPKLLSDIESKVISKLEPKYKVKFGLNVTVEGREDDYKIYNLATKFFYISSDEDIKNIYDPIKLSNIFDTKLEKKFEFEVCGGWNLQSIDSLGVLLVKFKKNFFLSFKDRKNNLISKR